MSETGPSPSFGTYLAALRSRRRLSVNALAAQTGISVARLLALEMGSGTPSRREIARLAKAFRVSEDSLLERAGHLRMNLWHRGGAP